MRREDYEHYVETNTKAPDRTGPNLFLGFVAGVILLGVFVVLATVVRIWVDLADNPPISVRVCDTPSSVVS